MKPKEDYSGIKKQLAERISSRELYYGLSKKVFVDLGDFDFNPCFCNIVLII
jgi:hypothetical protein